LKIKIYQSLGHGQIPISLPNLGNTSIFGIMMLVWW